MQVARAAGFASLSLSVARDNPAVALYHRFGFTIVKSVDGSWTMQADLAAGP